MTRPGSTMAPPVAPSAHARSVADTARGVVGTLATLHPPVPSPGGHRPVPHMPNPHRARGGVRRPVRWLLAGVLLVSLGGQPSMASAQTEDAKGNGSQKIECSPIGANDEANPDPIPTVVLDFDPDNDSPSDSISPNLKVVATYVVRSPVVDPFEIDGGNHWTVSPKSSGEAPTRTTSSTMAPPDGKKDASDPDKSWENENLDDIWPEVMMQSKEHGLPLLIQLKLPSGDGEKAKREALEDSFDGLGKPQRLGFRLAQAYKDSDNLDEELREAWNNHVADVVQGFSYGGPKLLISPIEDTEGHRIDLAGSVGSDGLGAVVEYDSVSIDGDTLSGGQLDGCENLPLNLKGLKEGGTVTVVIGGKVLTADVPPEEVPGVGVDPGTGEGSQPDDDPESSSGAQSGGDPKTAQDANGTSKTLLGGVGIAGLAVGAAGALVLGRRESSHGTIGGTHHGGGNGVGGGFATSALGPDGFGASPLQAGALGRAPGSATFTEVAPPAPAASMPVAPLAPAQGPPRSAAPGWTASVSHGKVIRLDDVGMTRIKPVALERGRVWGDLTDRYVAAGGWTEKITGNGEDAYPVLRIHDTGRGLVAVFDGTGGAGAGVARRLPDGTELTGAYVASRLSASVVSSWFTSLVDRQRDITPETVAELTRQLGDVLADEAAQQPVADDGLKGSMKRQLPTTMAAAAVAERDGLLTVDALWAGDSRAYVLGPLGGLQVLSVDDTRETDAMALIRNDMPMSNLLAADRAFRINHNRYELDQPALLVTATDGCFGYIHTPAHLEYLMLETLMSAQDMVTWSALLVDELDAVAGDDVSFSMLGMGFESFDQLKESFGPRCEFLRTEHWDRFAGLQEDRDRFESMREASWAAYAPRYHALLPVEAPEDAEP